LLGNAGIKDEKFKFIMANLKPDLTECSPMEIKKHFIAIRMIEGK
jgi:hypothetical protein